MWWEEMVGPGEASWWIVICVGVTKVCSERRDEFSEGGCELLWRCHVDWWVFPFRTSPCQIKREGAQGSRKQSPFVDLGGGR